MPFNIVRGDITKMQTDAVVNAANTHLAMGGGVCGAIFKAAGAYELQTACKGLAPVNTGKAVITHGFKLPARYIIHGVGPIYSADKAKECKRLLYSVYINCLNLALENKCKSIAFPLISSGIYGYPKAEAIEVAISAFKDFLENNEMDIYLALFDEDTFRISKELLDNLSAM